MRYDSAAILTDLDGTLFNSRGEVSADDRTAIEEFIGGGGTFAISTGREPGNIMLHLPDLTPNGPSIVLNGAGIYDFTSQKYLSTVLMDKETAANLVNYCQEQDIPLDQQIYTNDGIFYASPLEIAEPGFLKIHQPTSFLPLNELIKKDWFKVVFLERKEGALRPMRDYLERKGYEKRISLTEGWTDVVETGRYEELLPRGVNKGTAVKSLNALPAYKGRTVFAVGDYWNDLEMLKAADIPCAPANAIREIKEACRYILPSHNDSPIAHLIRQVIPGILRRGGIMNLI